MAGEKNRLLLLGLSFILGLVLVGCGNQKTDFDRAEYLLGRGSSSGAREAAALMESYLSSGDIFTRMRAHRFYGGAKINEAGFDAVNFFARLTHGSSNGRTVQLLKDVLVSSIQVLDNDGEVVEDPTLEQLGLQAEEYLDEGIAAIEDLRTSADYVAVSTATAEACSQNAKLCREKESVEVVLANLYFIKGLNLAIRLSTFGAETGFNKTSCEDYFSANEARSDDFAGVLLSARAHYALAGLDDSLVEGSDGQTDASNSKPAEFIDDIQEVVDNDRDGEILGTPEEKATIICDYLEGQE